LTTDRPCQGIWYFPVSRDGRAVPVGRIFVDTVLSALAKEHTSMLLQMPNQIAPFHEVLDETPMCS
jgi:hypothetical protein